MMMDEKTKEEANHLTGEEELQVIQGNVVNMCNHLMELPPGISVSVATSVLINTITALNNRAVAHEVAKHARNLLKDICMDTHNIQH